MIKSTAHPSTLPAASDSPRRRRAAAPPTIHLDSAEDTEPDESLSSASTAAAPASVVGEGFMFRGVSLENLTPSRQAAWAQHRLAVGASPLELTVADVNAFFADALRIIWLCSHDPVVWNGLRSNPAAMEQVIGEWADAVPGESAAETVLLGLKIYGAACEAAAF